MTRNRHGGHARRAREWIPDSPTDVNNMLTIVFLGVGKLKLDKLGNVFRVRKYKIWAFLIWLKAHNRLYESLPFDENIVNLYPEDGMLTGLDQHIIQDAEIDAEKIIGEETAGFTNHPASSFRTDDKDFSNRDNSEIMLEKMGVSDPESEKLSGRT